MPLTRLSEKIKEAIKERVDEFAKARKLVDARVDDYLKIWHEETTTSLTKFGNVQDTLNSVQKRPSFTRLVFKGNEYIWTQDDIATIIDKAQPTVSRAITAMEESDVWLAKLKDCRSSNYKQEKTFQDKPSYRYSKKIFDVILDFYEECAMNTYFDPPHGEPKTEPKQKQIKKFWEETKKTL